MKFNYLMQNKLTTPEELQERVSALSERIDTLKSVHASQNLTA